MSVLIKLRDCNSFSAAEAGVRDYILRNSRSVLKQTIYDVARLSFTSPATVSRMCKRLGVSSFQEFKVRLAEEVDHYEHLSLDLLDSTTLNRDDDVSVVVEKITNIEVAAIEETRLLIDHSIISRVSDLIRGSSVIDFYGVGASNLVAMDAHSKFMRVGKCSIVFQQYDRQYVQALNSDPNHMAVIFSYSGETAEMIKIAGILKRQGVPMVSITKSDRNSLSALADYPLFVTARETLRRSGAMASRSAMLYIVDIIYSMYLLTDYDALTERVSRTFISN